MSRVAPSWAPPIRLNSSLAGVVIFAAVTLAALAYFNQLLVKVYWQPNSWRIYAPFLGAMLGSAVFSGVRYNDFTTLLSASLRATAAGLVVYLLLEWPDFTLANPERAARAAGYVKICYFAALACAITSLVRPSFTVPTAIYIISTRHLVHAIAGLPMSTLDIRYMVDMALYLSMAGIAVATLAPRIHPWLASKDRQDEIVGAAFGLHLANYFWSGIAKLTIGPTPWYWTVSNETFNQIPHTIEAGILPIGHIPWLSAVAYEGFKLVVVPLNAAIVVAQLFALVCILRLDWLKVTSFLFDCLHIGIYVFGGLFFWPWIWNNLTIWWAARSAKRKMSAGTKIACMVTILLGFPGLRLNAAAWLAWFDVEDARQVYFEAVTRDGRAVKVPSAFFLSHSYSVSHAYMGAHALENHYEHTMQASTVSVERNEWSGTCPDPTSIPTQQGETAGQRAERLAMLNRLLRAHHEKMLWRETTLGRGNYYFHLHHHPSNPFLYSEFNQLGLADVIGYQLVLESNCHRLEHGRVAKRTWARDTEYFDVR